MKRFLLFSMLFLIFIGNVYASLVAVSTAEMLKGNLTSLFIDDSSNVIKFYSEFYNIGSIAYKARMRIDILNESNLVFTGWSKEEVFMPGDKKNFEMFWFSDSKGKYTFKLRIYFGNEISEYRETVFEVKKSIEHEDAFEIKEFRTYDDFVIFDLYSKRDVENLIIMPYKYTPGWIFEQKKIDSMKKNETKVVVVPYYPTVWGQKELKLVVVSNEGIYYTEKSLQLEKKTGLIGLFYYIVDNLKIIFS